MFKKLNKEDKILESEDPVKLNVKPIVHKQMMKSNEVDDDTKNSRLKAFQLMKSKNSMKEMNRNHNKKNYKPT